MASLKPKRVTVLYNHDPDATAVDVAAIRESAEAVANGLREAGYETDMGMVIGPQVFETITRLRETKPDLVFNLCESMAGDSRNEPTFVGLLDLFRIPYTGADLLALASCLFKQRTKDILLGRGVHAPAGQTLGLADLSDPTLDRLEYPQFVKLEHEDASVGITEANVVRSAGALRTRAKALIEKYEQPVIVERYVDGREINVTMVGNGADVTILPLHEIDFAAMPADRPRILSYAAKWDENHVDYEGTKPVPLRNATQEFVAAVERTARAAWHALGLRDYGRVDLRVDSDNTPWVIDVNPNPDISPDAGCARSAHAAGLSYADLMDRITTAAWQRVQTAM